MIPALIIIALSATTIALIRVARKWEPADPVTPVCDDPGCPCTGLAGDETHKDERA